MELAEPVRARIHVHAAGLDRGVGERDPGDHLKGQLEDEAVALATLEFVLCALLLVNTIVHAASIQVTERGQD
jgi:hypothetical protein